MTEQTIKSLVGSNLSIKALEHLGIPLGGALTVNTGADNDGTCAWDMDADDRDEVLSKLLGAAIAHYAVETMVMPSNADRLDNVRDFLKSIANNPRVIDGWGRGDMIDMIEQFEDFVDDIESVQQNLRP